MGFVVDGVLDVGKFRPKRIAGGSQASADQEESEDRKYAHGSRTAQNCPGQWNRGIGEINRPSQQLLTIQRKQDGAF